MANTFNSILNIAKGTNRIVRRAGTKMFNSSLSTAGQIAILYKDAGIKTFTLGKKVVVKSAKLALTNQKDLIKTTGNALKEVVQTIKDHKDPKNVSFEVSSPRKNGTTEKAKKLTIDDMLK